MHNTRHVPLIIALLLLVVGMSACADFSATAARQPHSKTSIAEKQLDSLLAVERKRKEIAKQPGIHGSYAIERDFRRKSLREAFESLPLGEQEEFVNTAQAKIRGLEGFEDYEKSAADVTHETFAGYLKR